MTYITFSTYLTYSAGDVVAYAGGVYIFKVSHVPGVWNPSEVIQVNQTTSYISADFNTLPDYNLSRPLANSMYHVNYYRNNENLVVFDDFPIDTATYLPGATVTIADYTPVRFSSDGVWAYYFTGWSLAKGKYEVISYNAGDSCSMPNHDINLFAQWLKVSTITVDVNAAVAVKTEYKDAIPSMRIPEYFEGTRIKTIKRLAFSEASISEIVIPPNITFIEDNAFENWTGEVIRFVDSAVTSKYPELFLSINCFASTPNLITVLLPYRWRGCDGPLFPAESKSGPMIIKIRNTLAFMKDLLDWDDRGYDNVTEMVAAADNPSLNYTRIITWGYND